MREMLRQTDKAALNHEPRFLSELCERCAKNIRPPMRLDRHTQPFVAAALQVRLLGMKRLQPLAQRVHEQAPAIRRRRERRAIVVDQDKVVAFGDPPRLIFAERPIAGEACEVRNERRRTNEGREGLPRVGQRERRTLRGTLGRAPLARRRPKIDELAAADRPLRRHVTQEETIALRRRDRVVEHDLDVARTARRDRSGFKWDDTRAHIRRRVVETRGKPGRDRLRLALENVEARVDPARRRVQARVDQHVAARHLRLGDVATRQI